VNVRNSSLTLTASSDSARGAWRKSSYSGGGNNCVEVATGPATVAVRDSKNPEGGQLVLGASAWTAFTTAIKRGGYGII
jgi:Domain of unknown function (DUF397)